MPPSLLPFQVEAEIQTRFSSAGSTAMPTTVTPLSEVTARKLLPWSSLRQSCEPPA